MVMFPRREYKANVPTSRQGTRFRDIDEEPNMPGISYLHNPFARHIQDVDEEAREVGRKVFQSNKALKNAEREAANIIAMVNAERLAKNIIDEKRVRPGQVPKRKAMVTPKLELGSGRMHIR